MAPRETAANENATSYFPLLDRISDGYFSNASTDEELYEQFLQILLDDGYLEDPESVSSFQLALSLRSSTPRIEAHYQYYHTAAETSLKTERAKSCSTWFLFQGMQYCSPSLDKAQGPVSLGLKELQLDRIFGNRSAPITILYADITSQEFAKFHKFLIKSAQDGKSLYCVRYKKSLTAESKPLIIPGWGVELALKKTDYIMIDDRNDNDDTKTTTPISEKEFKSDEVDDLKPLSVSEVSFLALKASSYIMQSGSPFDTLVKLSQDFPKYSSVISSHNTTMEFINEHMYNRGQFIQDGRNIIWMNGMQLSEKQVEILNLIDIMRKERKLINNICELGLSIPESIQLLSHPKLSLAETRDGVNRFDWTDKTEGGQVIIWLNNLEKDKKYADWPVALTAMLQRGYPGQLPFVRRDAFNLVIPVDLCDPLDLQLILETVLNFVNRRLPIRIGLVPITKETSAVEQAKIVYHLTETYGLQTTISYLRSISESKKFSIPSQATIDQVTKKQKVRPNQTKLSVDEILKSNELQNRIEASKKWLDRICADDSTPPILINGVVIQREDTWLQRVSQQIYVDLQLIQQTILLGTDKVKDENFWIPSIFLDHAIHRRNQLIIPEDHKQLNFFDINSLEKEYSEIFKAVPRFLASSSSIKSDLVLMLLIVDLDTKSGESLFATATAFHKIMPSIELLILHNPPSSDTPKFSHSLYTYIKKNEFKELESLENLTATLLQLENSEGGSTLEESKQYWQKFFPLIGSLGLLPNQNAIVINGRLIGPIPDAKPFQTEDLEMLISYERKERLTPMYEAMKDLGLESKIQTPLYAAKISSIISLSTISETPDGMFDQSSMVRINQFDIWKSSYTSIETGDAKTAIIHFTVLLDPATHLGQRWVSILKVLSEFKGVYLKLFLNPKNRLTELPVKRFYRYVLESQLNFDGNGAIKNPSGFFTDIPQAALLTVGLDIPPAWLVAPKLSIYDPDNIKLSSTKTDIKAVYELKHILIEGHSREVTRDLPPRGAQLVLGTTRNPHVEDTIIMENLGYFQFKANPGYYRISLQSGRSSEIYHIDSVGAQGWSPVPGDEKTDVILMDFKGVTLYPRLSRNSGMENGDVLEALSGSKEGLVSRLVKYSQEILAKGNNISEEQASINIFSVASGHLYERMLNIMIVSVMKHTKHSVKFWFIEQFLSPSFKDFIPSLAEEYKFSYEMVTYKWPHWLRAQSEKQREIWGYKILFLDVLFPLSLDKVIFVDADQIVRTDMIELINLDLKGAPYGFTPMCDSRTEMEGFRFWKKGYWAKFLRGFPYHISALYVVDLGRFRQIAAGDRLRQQYHALSADPGSLSNLDQDLPNHMQNILPIFSLPQEWLWCETWCSDESLKDAKTIDLCNNPLTKEPKLDRARRQVPEWAIYDEEIATLARKRKENHFVDDMKNRKSSVKDEIEIETTSTIMTNSKSKDEL